MSNISLLASAAIFRSLYDNNKDIYDVIADFIRAYIILNSKWAFNSTECTSGVNKTFGFNLPEAIIRTCLRNRLKKNDELDLNDGLFTITDRFNKSNDIQSKFNASNDEFEEIKKKLIEHVRRYAIVEINNDKLLSCLQSYLLNKSTHEEYAGYIAHFILKHENEPGFKEKLNRIEEGLILYAGIQYSPDLSELGHWRSDLTIFLDTEHLFSATGLNGVLYKQIFDDLNTLVRDVNFSKQKRGKISFRYFPDTKDEVDSFFYAAEKIIENNSSIDPSKTAMINIVNGCNSKSDILEKKAKFESDLARLKIMVENFDGYYKDPKYNIESTSGIERLQEKYNYEFGANIFSDILKRFTKINHFRNGESKAAIDNVAAIFLTEKWLVRSVAFSEEVYEGKGFVPYATNIEFLTERLWFKLNKGFGKNPTPHSFDVITKAKIVISSQFNNKISEEYNKLNKKYKSGEIDEKSTALLIAELRQKSLNPDAIDYGRLDEAINTVSGSLVENALREKASLQLQAIEGLDAKEELRQLKISNKKEKAIPIKKTVRLYSSFVKFLIYAVIPVVIVWLLFILYSPNDTMLSVFFGGITVVGFIFATVKRKSINGIIRRYVRDYFKKSLNKEFHRTSR